MRLRRRIKAPGRNSDAFVERLGRPAARLTARLAVLIEDASVLVQIVDTFVRAGVDDRRPVLFDEQSKRTG